MNERFAGLHLRVLDALRRGEESKPLKSTDRPQGWGSRSWNSVLTLDGLGAVEILVNDVDASRARELLDAAEAGKFRLADETPIDSEPRS